jgi:hypothetical protein
MLEVAELETTTAMPFKMAATAETTPAKTLAEFIGEALASVPQVEAVYGARRANVLHIYTVVDAFDSEVRKAIYKKEGLLIERLSGDLSVEFDFNILSRRGRKLSELIPESELVLCYRR